MSLDLCLKARPGDTCCPHVLRSTGQPDEWRCHEGHVWYGKQGGALKSTPWRRRSLLRRILDRFTK